MGSKEYVCPVCGQPVEAVVRRHKTLGVFVPLWRPGPCRNPDCRAYQGHGEPAPGPAGEPEGPGTAAPGRSEESGPVPKKS